MILSGLLLVAAAGWSWSLPPGFPAPRVPAGNPMSAEKAELGRRLFFDPRLSGNGTFSCASCHRPERAFTDGRARAVGSTGALHRRSAMSLANASYSASLTWADPGTTSLEAQSAVPMNNRHPVEMGTRGHESEILARLRAEPLYAGLFPASFPGERRPITLGNVRKAIASFERTILSGDSPYDRLVWKDDASAMSPAARDGMKLFFSDRIGCAKCHEGFTLSGPVRWEGEPRRAGRPARPGFARNGLGRGTGPRDRGLSKATGRAADRDRFRVPTLRNVAVTGPYMHDGRFATLSEVIDHYARGGDPGARPHPRVKGFAITEEEKRDLVAFLESLTDADFLKDPRFSDPWAKATERGGLHLPD